MIVILLQIQLSRFHSTGLMGGTHFRPPQAVVPPTGAGASVRRVLAAITIGRVESTAVWTSNLATTPSRQSTVSRLRRTRILAWGLTGLRGRTALLAREAPALPSHQASERTPRLALPSRRATSHGTTKSPGSCVRVKTMCGVTCPMGSTTKTPPWTSAAAVTVPAPLQCCSQSASHLPSTGTEASVRQWTGLWSRKTPSRLTASPSSAARMPAPVLTLTSMMWSARKIILYTSATTRKHFDLADNLTVCIILIELALLLFCILSCKVNFLLFKSSLELL